MEDKTKFRKSALDFLKSEKIAVISTISKENKPTTATILYCLDENLNFYFITRRHTRKFENLQRNKNVGIVVGAEIAPGTVQAQGEAELLEGEEAAKFIERLSKNNELIELYYGPFSSLPGIDFAIFKVKITWLRYLYFDMETKKEEYYQIISEE